MPPLRSTWILAVGLAVGSLPAQGAQVAQSAEAERRPTFVRVLDAAGEPIAGAVVTLAGCLPHLGVVAGPSDVLLAHSDARGRVQAKLQAGLCYLAWAVGPADELGSCLVSAVQGFFGAGALFDLRCDTRGEVRRLRVVGAESWRALGPLRFVAMNAVPGTELELEMNGDGLLALTPGPASAIEVRTADGQPLWSTASNVEELTIPPPRSVRVRVVDEHGAPLLGAVVLHRVARVQPWRGDGLGGVVEDRFRELAVIGAEGTAVVEVPYGADLLQDQSHGDLLLFASALGRPPVVGGAFGGALWESDRKVGKVTASELRFTCSSVPPLVGQCGVVPPGTHAHLSAVCKLFSDNAGYTIDARSFVAPVSTDGQFHFAELPAEVHSCQLTLLPPAGSASVLPQFAANAGRQLPPEVDLHASARASVLAAGSLQLDLQVLEPDGGPARGLVAFLAPGDQRGVLMRDCVVRFPLDARGAASLRLAPGRWVVLAMSNRGWAAKVLDMEPGLRREELPLQTLATMQVQLHDKLGQPVAMAQVRSRGTTTRGTGDPVQSMLQSLRVQARAQWATLRTDAVGRVVIPFVPVPGLSQRLALAWDGSSTADFVLEANDGPLILRPQ